MIHVNLESMSASRPEVFGQENLSNGRLTANSSSRLIWNVKAPQSMGFVFIRSATAAL
jgi:hypothetical protein